MYERLTTLVNIMDRNNVRPIPVSINSKFLNCLQPEWSKYVTMECRETKRNQAFNARNGSTQNKESNQTVQHAPRIESNPRKANVQCYNCNEKGHYARDCRNPRVRDAKYFRKQMLLARKDEAESNLNDEKNDFMLDNSFGDETLEELTDAVIMMTRIQPADDNAMTEPTYDAKAISETLKELQQELIEEVQEMSNIFESMEEKVEGKSPK
ncbi:retrovirus-related pol polyprotein from transposon TNT 1-94 [Tanacetum coccineum]